MAESNLADSGYSLVRGVISPEDCTRVAKELDDLFSRKEEDKKGLIVYSAGNSLDYAAYVEFGTGAKVSVPTELQDVASQFKSGRGGSFADALKNIKGWVKRKGLPESSAYPILMSILRKGLTPQPFLYPAFVINRNEFIRDMKNALIRLTKKLT